MGERVILVDLDPQANLTTITGVEEVELSSYDLLLSDDIELRDVVQSTAYDNLLIMPAEDTLAAAEVQLAGVPRRQDRLRPLGVRAVALRGRLARARAVSTTGLGGGQCRGFLPTTLIAGLATRLVASLAASLRAGLTTSLVATLTTGRLRIGALRGVTTTPPGFRFIRLGDDGRLIGSSAATLGPPRPGGGHERPHRQDNYKIHDRFLHHRTPHTL